MPPLKSVLQGICWVIFSALCGCAVGPDFVRPEAPAVGRYTGGPEPAATLAADGNAQRFARGTAGFADWWRMFKSAKLDALVNDAFTGNQSIQAAQSTLAQSRDLLRAGYGVFFPQLDASFDATRQKFSPARFGSGSPSSTFSLYTLSAQVSYALDVFGGERRQVEALQALSDIQRALLDGTYLALSGNVVNTAIAQAAYRKEIEATEQIISQAKEQVEITEAQARAGTVPYLNLLSLQSQLATFEATLPPLRQKLSQADHLLATLAGRTPAEWSGPQIDLAELTLPLDIPVTLPSELVRQRPDILAAEAQLHQASAQIGVATANLFPNFTLSGSYGQNNTSINELFGAGSSFWSLGATLAAPLFHGGTLWFQRKAAIEGYRQSLANYRQTVLSAFAQVADAIRALEHDAELLKAQSEALRAADEALLLTRANYQAGTVNYLQMLVANVQDLQARVGYLQAKAQRLQDTVAIFVALGKGWKGEDNTGSSGRPDSRRLLESE